MKTYGYYLILHILGLTGLIIAGVLAMLHGLWFCTIICGLLLIGICYSLYRIQIRQTETMYRLVECMKQNDLGQRVCAPFADPQMQKLAEELSQALKNLRTRIVDEEVKHQYYEMLLNKVDTAVLVTDRSNRMEWMNKAARELLGHCAHLPEEISTAIQENQQVAHLQKGNATFDLSLSVTHIQLQGRTCRLISLKNIHGALEYKEMEAWQKLIRVLTHEIMNSITPIISLADTLNERSQEHPDDARTHTYIQQGLQVIYRRGKGLLEFVENYRKLTRISAPMKTEIPLEQFLSDLQRLYPELEVQYKCPSSQLTWYADRTQMEQLFINLLKNAREACAHRSHPDIRIQVETHAQELIFEISDNGEGMLPEVTERIFVPFFTTKNNGSGIGLTLCKQIISLHGGQISGERKPFPPLFPRRISIWFNYLFHNPLQTNRFIGMDSLASILQKTGFCITRKHLNLIGIPASYQQKLAVRCNREITRMNARQLIAHLGQCTIGRRNLENSHAICLQTVGSIQEFSIGRQMNIRTTFRAHRICLDDLLLYQGLSIIRPHHYFARQFRQQIRMFSLLVKTSMTRT